MADHVEPDLRSLIHATGFPLILVLGGLAVAISVLAIYNPIFAAGLLAVCGAGFLVWAVIRQPYVGLFATVFTIPVQKTVELPIVGPKLTLSELVFFLTIFTFLAREIVKENRITIPKTSLNFPIACFLTAAIASMWNLLPGFFSINKDAPAPSDPHAAEFFALNQGRETDVRWAWELLGGSPDGYTLMQDNAIAVLNGEETPQQAADALQEGLAQWFEPAKTCKK